MSERASGHRLDGPSEARLPLPELEVASESDYEVGVASAKADSVTNIPSLEVSGVKARSELFAADYARLMAHEHTSRDVQALINTQFESVRTSDGRDVPPLLTVETDRDATGTVIERVVAASPEAAALLYEADRQVRLEAVREKLPSLEALVGTNPHEAEARIAHEQKRTYGPRHNPLVTKHEATGRDGKSRRETREHHPGAAEVHNELKALRDQARERIQAGDRKAASERARQQAEAVARADAAAAEYAAERLRDEQAAIRAEIMAAIDRDREGVVRLEPGQGGIAVEMFDRAPDAEVIRRLADQWVAKKVLARDAETGRLIMPARASFDAGARFTAETVLQRYGAAMERLAPTRATPETSSDTEMPSSPEAPDAAEVAYRKALDRIAHYAPVEPDDTAEINQRLAEFVAASDAVRTSDELGRIMALAFSQKLVERRHEYHDASAHEVDRRLKTVHFDGASPELTAWYAEVKARYDAMVNGHRLDPEQAQSSQALLRPKDLDAPNAAEPTDASQAEKLGDEASSNLSEVSPADERREHNAAAVAEYQAKLSNGLLDRERLRTLADEAVAAGIIKRNFRSGTVDVAQRYAPYADDAVSERIFDQLVQSQQQLEATRHVVGQEIKVRQAEIEQASGGKRATAKTAPRHAPVYRYQHEHRPNAPDAAWTRGERNEQSPR